MKEGKLFTAENTERTERRFFLGKEQKDKEYIVSNKNV